MLYAKLVTKAASNTQRKSISTVVTKEPQKSYGLIHHLLKPLRLTLQSYSSDYWINIFRSVTYYNYTIFNGNAIKVNYSSMNNVSQIIKNHNRNVSNPSQLIHAIAEIKTIAL